MWPGVCQVTEHQLRISLQLVKLGQVPEEEKKKKHLSFKWICRGTCTQGGKNEKQNKTTTHTYTQTNKKNNNKDNKNIQTLNEFDMEPEQKGKNKSICSLNSAVSLQEHKQKQ